MFSQRLGFRKIYRNLDKMIALFFTLFTFMDLIWVPFNSFAADFLLWQTGAEFVSFNNILSILIGSPLVAVGFVVLLLANLLVAYLQIGAIFLGVYHLLEEKERSLGSYLRLTFRQVIQLLQKIHLSKVLFILLYAGILFPFLRKLLRIYYLNKILIPEFIVTYLKTTYFLGGVIAVLVLAMFWLAVRWMFALPKLFFEAYSVRDAVAFSWEKTRGKSIRYGWALLWIGIKAGLMFGAFAIMLVIGQVLADAFESRWSLVFALVNYTLIHFAYYITLSYGLLKLVSLLTEKGLPTYPKKREDHRLRVILLTLSTLYFAGEGALYMVVPLTEPPLVISHRGVSQENGVQNTLESLEKTSLLKPDFVEMDIQETKDGQFVMMHDANLSHLAGVDAKPQELTLEELTSIEVEENGHRAKIPSFDAYLEKAHQLNQKLLIEVKVSPLDSPDMMKRFLEKYGPTIKERGHQVHSLDYKVVQSVLDYDQAISAFFILPYNTIFPQTKATGYTMEHSTLDEPFMLKLRLNQKLVYDWTINDEDSLQKSLHLGVDGVITDNLELVEEEIEETREDQDYYTILVDQIWRLTNM